MTIQPPRPSKRKFTLSLREIAALTGESLSKIKRQSTNDPDALAAKVNQLLGRRERASVTQYQYWDTRTGKPISADEKVDELLTELMDRENDLWYILSLLCALVPASNSALRTKLAPLFQTGREIVRDCPKVENEKESFDLRSPEVDEKIMDLLLQR